MDEHKIPKNDSDEDHKEEKPIGNDEVIIKIIRQYEGASEEVSCDTEKDASSEDSGGSSNDDDRNERTRSRGPKLHYDNDDE